MIINWFIILLRILHYSLFHCYFLFLYFDPLFFFFILFFLALLCFVFTFFHFFSFRFLRFADSSDVGDATSVICACLILAMKVRVYLPLVCLHWYYNVDFYFPLCLYVCIYSFVHLFVFAVCRLICKIQLFLYKFSPTH